MAGRGGRPILIAGLPRSGTSWVGEILSIAQGVDYRFEPDNEKVSPMGWVAKRRLHRFPYLRIEETAPDFEALWRCAFEGPALTIRLNGLLGAWFRLRTGGLERDVGMRCGLVHQDEALHGVAPGRKRYAAADHALMARAARSLLDLGQRGSRPAGRVIVKSVHAPLCLDWLEHLAAPIIVIVVRNPYSLFASYRRLRMPDAQRNVLHQPSLRDELATLLDGLQVPPPNAPSAPAFQIAAMYRVMADQLERHPQWIVVSHDELCRVPREGMKALYAAVGLEWGDAAERRLASLNRPGSGFQPRRVTADQPTKWRTELSAEEVATIRRWTEQFGLEHVFEAWRIATPGPRA